MRNLITSLRFVALLTLVFGIGYPLLVTGMALAAFPHQARGSMVVVEGETRGSALIGQPFDEPGYFWGRPSATTPAYNAANSTGPRYGPTNPILHEAIRERVRVLREADPAGASADGTPQRIPTDLATTSGSGLDPHITPQAAEFQVPRVAKARGMSEADVRRLVQEHTQGPQFGLLGEPVVNVFLLNLALDRGALDREGSR